MAARAGAEKKKREAARKQAQAEDESAGGIPRELRNKLKKAKAAKGLLKDLEEQVRIFVKSWEDRTKTEEKPELDSEDEEIVFVGRNGQMHDVPSSPKLMDSVKENEVERDRLVFDSLANDQGASFGYVQSRWFLKSPKVDMSLGAGWFIHLRPTMACELGLSPLEIQQDAKHTWESLQSKAVADHHPLFCLVPYGAWFEPKESLHTFILSHDRHLVLAQGLKLRFVSCAAKVPYTLHTYSYLMRRHSQLLV